MNEQTINGIKCDAKTCEYHSTDDKCTASCIYVNTDTSKNDAICETFKKKNGCCN